MDPMGIERTDDVFPSKKISGKASRILCKAKICSAQGCFCQGAAGFFVCLGREKTSL